LNKETYIKKSAELLARLVQETKMKNAVGLFDINRISEDKIIETIKKFKSHKLHEDFDSLNILLLTQKQNQYRSSLLEKEIENLSVDFDIEKNVLDPFDLLKKIDGLPTPQIKQISDYLEAEFKL